jgi:DNA topoisomerase-6 subunit A
MAIPKAKFIGLSTADPHRCGLPRDVGIKLNDKDVGRAKELLKCELDALANKDFRYRTGAYLPRELKEEDWLE